MSSENDEEPTSEQQRDDKGRFAPKTQTDKNGQTQTDSTDYPFMNAFMAEKLGLSDKFAELSQKFSPKELYGHLKFTAMTNEKQQKQQGLPDNEKVVPATPQAQKLQLPGTLLEKPNLTKDKFSVSFKMSPSELIKPKKE